MKKDISFEIMRVIAIFFVIFNHTGNKGYLLFTQEELGSIKFWLYLFASIFCLFSVPLFFMISGALMLEREEPFVKIIKRVGKFLIVLFGISCIYYLFDIIVGNKSEYGLLDFLKLLYTSQVSTHLWYLYAYIVYLLCLPVLRAIAKNLNEKYFMYLFGLWIVYNAVLPIIEFFAFNGAIHISGEFNIGWLFTRSVFYPLMGYYANNKMDIKKFESRIGLLIGVDVVCIGISAFMDYYKSVLTGEYTETFHASFIALHALVIFIVIKYWTTHSRVTEKLQKIILSAGASSFGIYLIHVLFLRMSYFGKCIDLLCEMGINALLSCYVGCVVVFGICWLIIFMAKKILILNRLI